MPDLRQGIATLALFAAFGGIFFNVMAAGHGEVRGTWAAFAVTLVALLTEPGLWRALLPQDAWNRPPVRYGIYAVNIAFWLSWLTGQMLASTDLLMQQKIVVIMLVLLCMDIVFHSDFSIRTVPLFGIEGIGMAARGFVPPAIVSLGMLVVLMLDYTRKKEQSAVLEQLRSTEERLRATAFDLHHQEILANHDDLTGLLNRRGFENVVRPLFDQASRERHAFGLLFFDIDDFKDVNDSLGHQAGDDVLRELAFRIRKEIRPDVDFLGRMGGDEFVIGTIGASLPGQMEALGERVRRAASRTPFAHGVSVTVSVGCTLHPDCEASSYEELVAQADAAMYRSKEAKDGTSFYCEI